MDIDVDINDAGSVAVTTMIIIAVTMDPPQLYITYSYG
jgi:hypothetical protein